MTPSEVRQDTRDINPLYRNLAPGCAKCGACDIKWDLDGNDLSMYDYIEETDFPEFKGETIKGGCGHGCCIWNEESNPLEELSGDPSGQKIHSTIKHLPRNVYYKIPSKLHPSTVATLFEEGLKFSKKELTFWLYDCPDIEKALELIPIELAVETAIRCYQVDTLRRIVPYYPALKEGTAPEWFKRKLLAMYGERNSWCLRSGCLEASMITKLVEDQLGWTLFEHIVRQAGEYERQKKITELKQQITAAAQELSGLQE